MSRKQRRQRGQRPRHQFLIGDAEILNEICVACPDCNSETERWTDALGMPHISLLHDDTCPVWRSMQ